MQFIFDNYILIIEVITLIVGIASYDKFRNTPLRVVLLYLFIVIVVEIFGKLIKNNQWMYNIMSTSELLIFSYVFYNSLEQKLFKKLILVAAFIGPLFILFDILFLTKTYLQYLSISFGVSSCLISFMAFLCVLEMASSEKVLNLKKELLYWIIIGLMIYHLCNLPATMLINNLDKSGVDLILTIQSISGIGLYVSFIIGFIWAQKSS